MLHIYGTGRLVAAPEMKQIPSKKTGEARELCSVRIASDNDYPSEKSSFIRLNAWGAKARYLYKAGHKGSYVEFDGELTIPEYDKSVEKQYEPELQISAKGHLRVLVLQKRTAASDDYPEESTPYYGEEEPM
ncbi:MULTISPECIES: single-stranded DNA-binding protein [Caproicibacterium]|uniref:Single-stranded DNA-binding protein n=1 Tax=Caproicibacterium argilliputei TaxID=3030016 RepID=A0AA97H181_9FIRM|nr:single-stranded DNA-binding protein [Caproicibacterium argilliputei]WOC32371.1 single-stranded DNA-binding protein [Caproicibacterium argilliputei]